MSVDRDTDTATVITSGPNAGKILPADSSTDLYDPATNTFAPGPVPMHSRNFHTATVIHFGPNAGKILFAGGLDDCGPLTELYDPAANTFAPGPAMNVGRQNHTATVIASGPNAGKILLAGGIGSRSDEHLRHRIVSLASTELYDPATNTFAPGPPMNGAPGEVVAVQLPPAPPVPVRRH